jgi:hypothetical protein
MPIYTDVQAAEDLIRQSYDLTTGEILDEQQLQQAEALKAEIIAQGLESLCKVRANKLADIAALKAEIDRLTERTKRADAEIERLEDYINFIYQQGDAPVQTAGNFTISTRKSTQVVIDDGFNDNRFMRSKVFETVDKSELKKALAAGEQIAGAHLQTNYNLQIK